MRRAQARHSLMSQWKKAGAGCSCGAPPSSDGAAGSFQAAATEAGSQSSSLMMQASSGRAIRLDRSAFAPTAAPAEEAAAP